jgi:rhomboid protease GluP
MKILSYKLRLIYKPFVLIAIGFIVIYTFLNWLFFIKGGMPIRESLIKDLLPMFLPFIPVFICFRSRIKYLYIPVDKISQMRQYSKTKYYSLKNYYIDKEHRIMQGETFLSGRSPEYFNINIYVVMPILENETDITRRENKYWLGKKYHTQVMDLRLEEERTRQYDKFVEQVQTELDEIDLGTFTYLEVIGNTKDHDGYKDALKRLNQKSVSDNIVFEAQTEPFEARNGQKLAWFFGLLGIVFLAYFIFLLILDLEISELEKLRMEDKS